MGLRYKCKVVGVDVRGTPLPAGIQRFVAPSPGGAVSYIMDITP